METHLTRPINPLLSNGRLGMMLVIGTETVLFSSFIGAYIVLKAGTPIWPPLGTPKLMLDLSVLNTVLLIFSSLVLRWTASSADSKRRGVAATLLMGIVFLLLQAVEFHRLYAQGLTLQRGVFGALFYSLITLHGLHVLGGLSFFAYLLKKFSKERLGHAELYWHFVTLVWLVLFGILYLA